MHLLVFMKIYTKALGPATKIEIIHLKLHCILLLHLIAFNKYLNLI
jgi:hypothetical protein